MGLEDNSKKDFTYKKNPRNDIVLQRLNTGIKALEVMRFGGDKIPQSLEIPEHLKGLPKDEIEMRLKKSLEINRWLDEFKLLVKKRELERYRINNI